MAARRPSWKVAPRKDNVFSERNGEFVCLKKEEDSIFPSNYVSARRFGTVGVFVARIRRRVIGRSLRLIGRAED